MPVTLLSTLTQHGTTSNSSNSSLFVTESAFLRCCSDFGLSPHLSSSKQLRETYRHLAARDEQRKVIVTSRLPMPHNPLPKKSMVRDIHLLSIFNYNNRLLLFVVIYYDKICHRINYRY